MDEDFIGIEKYLDRTDLMQQCIDYHDIFHFSIDWMFMESIIK